MKFYKYLLISVSSNNSILNYRCCFVLIFEDAFVLRFVLCVFNDKSYHVLLSFHVINIIKSISVVYLISTI
jgi:hypothetical protein